MRNLAIKHSITLSTTEPNNEVGNLKIRQGDEQTQTLVANITENGVPKPFVGLQPFFCAKLGQTAGLGIIEQKVTGPMNPANGTLEYVMQPEDWQQLGRQTAYFSFRKMVNDHEWTEQFSTRDFNYNVIKSAFSEGVKETKKDGSTYIWTIEDMLRLFDEYIASGKTDWEEFVEQNREVLESVDPGGKLIGELIDARRPFGGDAYPTLRERLDSENAKVSAQLAHTTQGLLTNRNAKHALLLPTYEGSGQSVHPSVVNTPASFGGVGLTWYMAHTPYPNTNDEYENPSLLGSVNGEDWINVGTNPIDKPTPEEIAEGAYMSDPEMIYKDGRLELVYRFNHGEKEVLYRKTSTTGTTWTERELIFDKDTFGFSIISPSIIYEDGKYRMWTVVPSGTVHYYESITGTLGTWSSPKVVPIQYRDGTGAHSPWHISVFKDSDAMYYLVLNAIIPNSTFMRHILIGKSSDGLSFNDTYTLMKPNNDAYAFDNNYLYRAMIVKRKGQYYLYYSAINGDGRWGIGLSKGNTIETIAGFDYRSWNASVSIPRIMTENLSVRGGGVLNNEELLFHTPGVKSVKLKNSFPNELNLLTQQGNPARFLSKEIGLSTGSTGGNIGPSGVQNVLQIRNNENNGPGHLEVAHLLLKDTTNTLNVEGALRYSPTKKKLEFYNGTSWETVTSS